MGTGFIKPNLKPNKTEYFIRRLDIKGLRGKLTQARLEKQGFNVKLTVLGDWELIASRLFPATISEKIYDIGIIPYYIDQDNEDF